MKVYALINTCKNDVEGVFTYECKPVKNRELFKDARNILAECLNSAYFI